MRRFFRRITFCLEEPAILPISQIHTLSIWHDLFPPEVIPVVERKASGCDVNGIPVEQEDEYGCK